MDDDKHKRLAEALADARHRAAQTPDFVRAINQGATMGGSGMIDGAGAALETGLNNLGAPVGITPGAAYSPADAFAAVKQAERERSAQFAAQHPYGNFALQTLGGMATGKTTLNLAKAVLNAPRTVASSLGQSALGLGAAGAGYATEGLLHQ